MPSSELQWVEIPSFAPGIVDEFAPDESGRTMHTPAPIGSARRAVGCVALPNGSLAPGWKIVENFSATPYNNNWTSPNYRPAGGKQIVCDTAMLSPSHLMDTTVVGDIDEHVGTFDRPDHLIICYGEAYNSAGTGPAATDTPHWYPLVYKMTGWIGGQQLPVTGPQTDNAVWNSTYNGQAFSGFTHQHNRVGGTCAVGRTGQFTWNHTTGTAANTLSVPPPLQNSYSEVVWVPYTRRSPKVVWQAYPQNGTLTGGAGISSLHNMQTSIHDVEPVSWGPGDRHAAAACFHQFRFVYAKFKGTGADLYGGLVVAGPTVQSLITPGVEFSERGNGCFLWDATETKYITGTTASPADTYGTWRELAIGDGSDQIAWMISLNGDQMMLMFSGTGGAYTTRGSLDAVSLTRLAGTPGCYRPYSKPVAVGNAAYAGTTVAWASRQGVYSMTDNGTVTPLSPNLQGRFWVPEGRESMMLSYAQIGKLQHRDPWLLAPNDYLCDVRSTTWWQLPRGVDPRFADVGIPALTHYEVGASGHVYAVPEYRDATNHQTYLVYDPQLQMDQADDIYLWESNPIHEFNQSPGQTLDVREVEVEVSGHGTVEVIFDGLSTAFATVSETYATFHVDQDEPLRLTANIATRSAMAGGGGSDSGSASIRVRIHAYGLSDGAVLPAVHNLRFGTQVGPGIANVDGTITPHA